MSQIRAAKAVDIQAFPGSVFVINGTPPIAQCQETPKSEVGPAWNIGQSVVTYTIDLSAIDLTGKNLNIVFSAADDGNYTILSHSGQSITINHTFIGGNAGAVTTITDIGQNYLTRNEVSFQKFIESQNKAHTTKAGQLYTDLTDPPMDDACSDNWNPE